MTIDFGYFRAVAISHPGLHSSDPMNSLIEDGKIGPPTVLFKSKNISIFAAKFVANEGSNEPLSSDDDLVLVSVVGDEDKIYGDRSVSWLLARDHRLLRRWHHSVVSQLVGEKQMYGRVPLPELVTTLISDSQQHRTNLRLSAITLRLEGSLDITSVTVYARENLSVEKTSLHQYLIQPYKEPPAKSCRLVYTNGQLKPLGMYMDGHGSYAIYLDKGAKCLENIMGLLEYLTRTNLFKFTSDVPAIVKATSTKAASVAPDSLGAGILG